ncbi:transposase [Variovorax sp. GrIS 2.14]|uniref:transposase n=1 Tax=Variovorax sp. GrIS 2.14 TaxID=3071709 RepID=UPI0038F7DEBD
MSGRSHSAPERVDRTHPVELQPGVPRLRSDGKRIYAEDCKTELVRQCLIPGTSVAATAMAHRINANLLRRWIGLKGPRSACSQ